MILLRTMARSGTSRSPFASSGEILGPPIFDETSNIRPGVTFAELAAHVYFTETGEPIPKRPSPHPSPLPKGEGKRQWSPLLGVHNGKAVYLLFNGILGDRSPGGGNGCCSEVVPGVVETENGGSSGPSGVARTAFEQERRNRHEKKVHETQ